MNIRYPIYEGVYRILTPTSLESVFPVASLSGLTVNPVAEK